MINRATFVRWTSGVALGVAASAFVSVNVAFPTTPAKAASVPTVIDPQVAFCRASVDHHQYVVSAAIYDAVTKAKLYDRTTLPTHASAALSDAAYAVNQKTGEADGLFHVNAEGWGATSCDVGNSRYLVLEAK